MCQLQTLGYQVMETDYNLEHQIQTRREEGEVVGIIRVNLMRVKRVYSGYS